MAGDHWKRAAWVDATFGVAGDMLLAALLDAGARIGMVQGAIDAVLPATVRLSAAETRRGGLRAVHLTVEHLRDDAHHRDWSVIRELLEAADLPPRVKERALRTFEVLAEAEGRVHGVPMEEVEFHEVGSWDSIADVVGVCAALEDLGVATLGHTPITLGAGTVRGAHGLMPVPVPAVVELLRGTSVHAGPPLAGVVGELATPTGVALLVALGEGVGPFSGTTVGRVGIGAGTRQFETHPNVVRVIVTEERAEDTAGVGTVGLDAVATVAAATDSVATDAVATDAVATDAVATDAVATDAVATDAIDRGGLVVEQLTQLDTNVDDLDPRVWPSVLTALMDAGARDAWLTPILMKKGRPAHTLSVLADDAAVDALRSVVFSLTSTIGTRETIVTRRSLPRRFESVTVRDGSVRLKVAHRDGRIVNVSAEYDDVAALARTTRLPVRQALEEAHAAAADVGLRVGSPYPAG